MCGFAGCYGHPGTAPELEAIALRMADAIAHRGPDDRHAWADAATSIALGFRRLAILDLTPEGRQPMVSARHVIAFNGEIYNFRDLRKELAASGHAFRGHSDTEVILAAVKEWGVLPALERLVGMFAIALWDRQTRTLYLARDRLGEKPLYYGWAGEALLFGSDLDALRAHPLFRSEVDRDALRGYARFGYVPGPMAIWKGYRKLLPGHVLVVAGRSRPSPVCYWDLRQAMSVRNRSDPTEARAELVRLLRRSVRECMVADVPLGAFLSGGVDSSLVVALMQSQSPRPVRTFTIGFRESDHDEAPYARRVAAHLGTDHTELYLTGQDALDVVPRLADTYDEPFSDSSQIPTSLVARLARQHVTVSLSGDGGDELFGGYGRYALVERMWRRLHRVPLTLRSMLGHLLQHASAARSSARSGGKIRIAGGDRLGRLARQMRARRANEFYATMMTTWDDPAEVVLGGSAVPTGFDDPTRLATLDDPFDGFMYTDTITYLPDDILVKVDRATMAVSLECRAPFLDHRIADFLWSLPHELRRAGLRNKTWLKEILYDHVPKAMIDRPKMGFGVPLAAWLRGPLRPWAEALLERRRLEAEGYFVAAVVRKRWEEHQSGVRNCQSALWNILMFQSWLDARR